jgi:hypothetical protein
MRVMRNSEGEMLRYILGSSLELEWLILARFSSHFSQFQIGIHALIYIIYNNTGSPGIEEFSLQQADVRQIYLPVWRGINLRYRYDL